jgi:hypothetical protein
MREQAEQMDAPDRCLSLNKGSCAAGFVHTWANNGQQYDSVILVQAPFTPSRHTLSAYVPERLATVRWIETTCAWKSMSRRSRILGSKSNLLQALIAGTAETKQGAEPSFVPKWRTRHEYGGHSNHWEILVQLIR